MSKYDPLYKWLVGKSATGVTSIPTTFDQIEAVLGFKLPDSARTSAPWWANEKGKSHHVQCKAWIAAGFETRDHSLATESVVYRGDIPGLNNLYFPIHILRLAFVPAASRSCPLPGPPPCFR